jgi:hypothetical protein
MKVAPYYALPRGLALEDLWHNNNECELGLSIGPRDRLPGKGKSRSRKHCPYCEALNKPRPKVTRW